MLLAGFYNNEDSEGFSPKPIEYATVSAGDVWTEMLPYAEAYTWARPTTVLAHEEVAELLDRVLSQEEQAAVDEHAAAILIVRHHELIAAKGRTELLPGDHVYIFCRHQDAPYVDLLFGRPILE